MRYGNPACKKSLARFAGKECTDRKLIHDIVECKLGNLVGKLVPPGKRGRGRGKRVHPPTDEDFEEERGMFFSSLYMFNFWL